MPEESWHGLRGPADFLLPDDTRELIYSGLSTLVFGGAGYVMHHREVTRVIRLGQEAAVMARVYAAAPRAVYPKVALRSAVGRTVTRGGWMKGAAISGAAIPGVGLLFTALSIAYSIPPDVRSPETGMSSYEVYVASSKTGKFYLPNP